ncbi:MAG: hypothetical protein SGPRY_002562 [Prymnesium sp.]
MEEPSRKRRAAEGARLELCVRSMMYGFGDASPPLTPSVQLLEAMTLEYLTLLLHKAHAASEQRIRAAGGRGEGKVKERDLLFVLRKDRRRYRRVQEVLEVYKEQREMTQERPEYAKDEV